MQDFASKLLTFLERREEKLLSWGFHDIQYTESEIFSALNTEASQTLVDEWRDLQNQGVTQKGLIRLLRQTNLLYLVPGAVGHYRTRMAEGVRLLSSLRQLFKSEDWSVGPRLVSDIKVHLKDRRYPDRNEPALDVWSNYLELLFENDSKSFLKKCFSALSQDQNGNYFDFAGFQRRSFINIIKEYSQDSWSATVVSAGTGSGKTKAFYVPAFLKIAEEIRKNPAPYTKVIAIYPRNVLLADQLREAISESLKLQKVFSCEKIRPISFGALLGSTPWKQWFDSTEKKKWHWESVGYGHVIPHLSSPIDDKSRLIWKSSDRESNKTGLYREGQDKPDVPDGVLKITRNDLVSNPPDVLFLSLEMLNQEMGNPEWSRSFGIGQGAKAPRLVLLDEIHTYEGLSGAEPAWVLRRWKYWTQRGKRAVKPHFVGLSATLRNATGHMAKLCGVRPEYVSPQTPNPGIVPSGEHVSEGQEYNLVVKGDPSSGTSLLSTSIQTAMLLTRLLTPRSYVSPSPNALVRPENLFLRKCFGFTDNLDSLNRWYSSMRDAEYMRLAELRKIPQPMPSQQVLSQMRDEGQVWELPELLGYRLSDSLDISRCSSQDPGVNVNSDIVLATSSLEVGFDDPQVGMILHHKAPRSMSSFVQRKGRAGRTRGSRPWTVVILSDYGRDRWAFQSAERLFQPELDEINLPISNPYVLRIQVALFLVDWLGHDFGKGTSPHTFLSGPGNWSSVNLAQQKTIKCLEDFLDQGAKWNSFYQQTLAMYMNGRGLSWNNSDDKKRAAIELDRILWDEPRPLLVVAIPSLLRKLQSQWKKANPKDHSLEDHNRRQPLPSFIPTATFQDLDLYEGRIELEDFGRFKRDDEFLAISQFLRESCPGNVSKRYSIASFGIPEPGYWHAISPSLNSGVNTIDLSQLYPENFSIGVAGSVSILRPISVSLVHTEKDVVESSYSAWCWNTDFNVIDSTNILRLPVTGSKPWSVIFKRADAYLHSRESWIELRRYAKSCEFDIRKKQGQSIQGTLELVNANKESQAIGFQLNTDGIIFQLRDFNIEELLTSALPFVENLHFKFFLDKVKSSDLLKEKFNQFKAEWMAQVSAAMLCATAVRKRTTLKNSQHLLKGIRVDAARKVLDSIFQIPEAIPGNEEESRLKKDLIEYWQDQDVVSEIEQLESFLWATPKGNEFAEWLQKRFVATIAQALRVALARMSDQVSEEDLTVDVISSQTNVVVLVSEGSSGGLGQIEQIVQEVRTNPRYFLDSFEHSLKTCPRETWERNLKTTLDAVCTQHKKKIGPLAQAFADVRNARGITELENAKSNMVEAIQDQGLKPTRANISAVSMKLLRPGSSAKTDVLTHNLNKVWERTNRRIGLQLPIRTFAYLVVSYLPSYRRIRKLFELEYNQTPSVPQLYAVVQQLLFDGCSDSCPDCLDNPNHFNDFGQSDRSVTTAFLRLSVPEVTIKSVADPWKKLLRKELQNSGRATLVVPVHLASNLLGDMTEVFFKELNVGTLQETIRINGFERDADEFRITYQIRNFANA